MDNPNEQENLDALRHSAAHLLAAAVMQLWPEAKRTIGPAIEDGFYFDFDFGETKVSEDDLPRIEEKMREILPTWKGFDRHELTAEEAKQEYPNNPYKHELIDEFSENGKLLVSFFRSGDYWDLCRGGHVEHPDRELKHFRLLSVAGAYWRGDEKNTMLTRIYGTVFPTKNELESHLARLEEAKKRDHRKLGRDLDLFVFSDLVGKGLPLFTEKGATIRRELERFIVDEEIKRGYSHVYTPEIAKTDLYRTSGHYPYYKETMYPAMVIDEEELILRPMTCPHHFMLYASKPRSYRDLPIRYAELAGLFRYEKSGELTGLLRVRTFCLADAHIIARADQARDEVNAVLDLIDFVNTTFGLVKGVDYQYRLSLGDRNDTKKFAKNDDAWDAAEQILRQVLVDRSAPFYEAPGEAAFYGPKIDIQMKNVMGKEDTAFTVQYDFVMPERFNMSYVSEDGTEVRPVVIHRSSIGALERTLAFLIERYGGAFPLWLAPVQLVLIPIAERHAEHAHDLAREAKSRGIRVEVDDRNETMQAKIRAHTLQKTPYMGIIGDREIDGGTVSIRTYRGKDLKAIAFPDLLRQLVTEIETRALETS